MSEELQKPPVLDIDVLLRPLSDENPAGESMRYSGVYDEISEARRADDNMNQGDWQSDLKVADYRRVIELAVPVLTSQSKDLQIAAWLTEAVVKEHGFAGLRDGLKLLAQLQENFWDTLHPELDEGDMEGRANAVAWMDTQAGFAIKGAAITAGEGYSFFDWEDSQRFDIPDNIESLDSTEQAKFFELKTQAETERRVTGELWRKAKAQTRRQFCEEVNYAIGECLEAFTDLNRVIEEKYDRNQMPGLPDLKKSLEDIQLQVKKLLEEKRAEEPDETDDAENLESGENEDETPSEGGGVTSVGGAIQGRRDALKKLGQIAEYFQKTEPHSPVAHLVQRAVKWGNMPLESWLQDVIKDESVLFQIRQTLGLPTGSESVYGESEEASG